LRGAGLGAVCDDEQRPVDLLVLAVLAGPELVHVDRGGALGGIHGAPQVRAGRILDLRFALGVHVFGGQGGPVTRAGHAGVVGALEVGLDVAVGGGDHGDVGGALDDDLALGAAHVEHPRVD